MSNSIHRKVYTYNLHLSAALYYLDASKDGNQSEYYNSIGAIVFSAFALEAFLNHVGEQLFKGWKTYLKKSLNPEAKLSLICEKISVNVDFGVEPFKDFRTIFRFRNAMAHSVTESLNPEEAEHYLEVGEKYWPAAKWEKLCCFGIAKNLVSQAEELINLIDNYTGLESIPNFILSEFKET